MRERANSTEHLFERLQHAVLREAGNQKSPRLLRRAMARLFWEGGAGELLGFQPPRRFRG